MTATTRTDWRLFRRQVIMLACAAFILWVGFAATDHIAARYNRLCAIVMHDDALGCADIGGNLGCLGLITLVAAVTAPAALWSFWHFQDAAASRRSSAVITRG